jgi:hypothetical protein
MWILTAFTRRYIHLTEEVDNIQDEMLSTVQDIEFWISKIQRGKEVVADVELFDLARMRSFEALDLLLDSLEIRTQ